QAEDGIRDFHVTGVQTCALPISLLRLPDPPTAIFALNDGMAIGVYHAASQAGLRIPQDLSVVGYDDYLIDQWLVPPLTTVRQPQIGSASCRESVDTPGTTGDIH